MKKSTFATYLFWDAIFQEKNAQGKEFGNNLLKEIANLCSIKRTGTLHYHPQSNDELECINRITIIMLKNLIKKRRLIGKIILKIQFKQITVPQISLPTIFHIFPCSLEYQKRKMTKAREFAKKWEKTKMKTDIILKNQHYALARNMSERKRTRKLKKL